MPEPWTANDLRLELTRFERELRDAGMTPNTIATYVGRSETFLRWLVGDYTPRGPNSPTAGERAEMPDGFAILHAFGSEASPEEIRDTLRRYEGITGYDASLNKMKAITGPIPDLSQAAHREALIDWLRSWGCRHLRKSDTARTSEALRTWWEQTALSIPPPDAQLALLEDGQLLAVAKAYASLAATHAAGRALSSGEAQVSFGDTAAAKTLFAIRSGAVPPWDEPIRSSLGWASDTEVLFFEFLRKAKEALRTLSGRLGVNPEDIPELLNRPTSTPAKIVDEYLWVRVTRGL